MSPSQGRLKDGEAEMVWICAEEGERIYWTPAGQEGRRKASEKTDGCSDGGRAEGWCDGAGCWDHVENRNCSVFSPQIKNWKLFLIFIILNRIKVSFCPLVKQGRKYFIEIDQLFNHRKYSVFSSINREFLFFKNTSPQWLKATVERSYLDLNQRPE